MGSSIQSIHGESVQVELLDHCYKSKIQILIIRFQNFSRTRFYVAFFMTLKFANTHTNTNTMNIHLYNLDLVKQVARLQQFG